MQKKLSKVRFLIQNKTFFKYLLFRIKKKSYFGNFDEYEKYVTSHLFNYKFNYEKPRTFNEHLVWLKKYYRNDLWEKCADKLGSKAFLEEIGLGRYLPRIYGIYDSSTEIVLNDLPDEFVLKTNNDSGSVYICKKGVTDFASVFKKLDDGLSKKYSGNNYEWVYDNIKPKIFAEEVLYPDAEHKELIDFKFQTVKGRFVFGYVLSNKKIDERHDVFVEDFKIVRNCLYQSLRSHKKNIPAKPSKFSEMIELSEIIGKHFYEVRVDMFLTNHGVKIGELTFFTQSGHGQFTKKKYDYLFGESFDN